MTKSAQTHSATPAVRSAQPRLTDALWRYHIDSDVQALGRAYRAHVSRKAKSEETVRLIDAIIRAFGSFVIAPRTDSSYKTILKNRTDAEAIGADWVAVGEDLSSVITMHILHKAKTDEKNK